LQLNLWPKCVATYDNELGCMQVAKTLSIGHR
jgi:hypothetical protein